MRSAVFALLAVTATACATTPDVEHTGPPRQTTTSYDVPHVAMDFTPAPTTTTTQPVVQPIVPATVAPPVTVAGKVVPLEASPPVTHAARSGGCAGWESVVAAHFPASEVGNACSVLLCESEGNPNAVSPTNDHGLFQINVVHRNSFDWSRRYDPHVNTAFAASLWSEQGWNPWTCQP